MVWCLGSRGVHVAFAVAHSLVFRLERSRISPWTNPEVLERLFIATLASFDNKVRLPHTTYTLIKLHIHSIIDVEVNIREIATLYGGEMTYDAREPSWPSVWIREASK